MRMRERVAAFLAVALVVIAAVGNATAGRPLIASLRAGDSVFWHGPYIKSDRQFDGCRGKGRGCFAYRLEVAEPGARLRVAFDYPMGNEWFDFHLLDPHGEKVEPKRRGIYSQEIFVKKPDAGTWKVVVVLFGASETAFRLRAKLEADPRRPSERRVMAPNLRLEPPFDFRFRPPSTMVAGANIAGGPRVTDTCGIDETIEESARRCLRLSIGPQNVGDGPLELRFSPMTDAATAEAPMYQLVHYSDGTIKERRAGTYEYHKMHGHYHFSGFAKLQLFHVTDRDTGALKPAGDGHKSGFCFGDVLMNSWHEFTQDRAMSSRSSCGDRFEAYMGLTRGWTDIYTWNTPGNYVEFGENSDGRYVVRGTVDATDAILETDETDNVSYAYIEVTGQKVRILERGFGSDPWDPDKKVLMDWVEALFGPR